MPNHLNFHRAARMSFAAILALAASAAFAQGAYPTKPVRLIVGSSPGGGTDTTARLIQPKLAELLGQQIVVENRPGAASMIGTEHAARSDPDGYPRQVSVQGTGGEGESMKLPRFEC